LFLKGQMQLKFTNWRLQRIGLASS